MATYQNERFESQDITVDGNQYTDCTFESCVLIFEGGDVPVFNRCSFRNIKIQLKGAAAQTTNYLGTLQNSGLPDAVEVVLEDVRRGIPLLPDRPAPSPAANTGSNVGALLLSTGIFALVVGWLFILYLFAWILQPMNRLESGQFLETEISFDLIPVLPDSLAEAYDLLRDNQLEQLSTTQWIDEAAGIARIPVGDAIEIMLANDAFIVGDNPVTNTMTDDSIDSLVEDALSTEGNDGSTIPPAAADAPSETAAEADDAAAEEDADADTEAEADEDAAETEGGE